MTDKARSPLQDGLIELGEATAGYDTKSIFDQFPALALLGEQVPAFTHSAPTSIVAALLTPADVIRYMDWANIAELHEINEACVTTLKDRHRSDSLVAAAWLAVGDRVMFNLDIKPRLLAGVEGTLVEKTGTKIVVDLDHPHGPTGKWFKGIRCPASMVEKV